MNTIFNLSRQNIDKILVQKRARERIIDHILFLTTLF